MRGMGGAGSGSGLHLDRVEAMIMQEADPAMAAQVSQGISESVLASTRGSYNTATRQYLNFCETRSLVPWPVTSRRLCAYMHWKAPFVSMDLMGVYTAGVQYSQGSLGIPWSLHGDDNVRRTWRFLKRKFPVKDKPEKFPMSVEVLRLFAPMLPGWPNLSAMSEEDRVFIVASTLAVCWFLRGGEFLWSPKSDPGSLSGLYWRLK